MADLATTRQAIAAALNAVEGLNVSARPRTMGRGLDGWVTVGRIEPADFTRSLVTFTAVVLLAPDELAAEQLLEQYAVDAVNAITSTLNAADVAAEPAALVVGQASTPMYALTITLTLEVD